MMMGLRLKKYKTRQAPQDWGRSIIREAARQWGHREACCLSHIMWARPQRELKIP